MWVYTRRNGGCAIESIAAAATKAIKTRSILWVEVKSKYRTSQVQHNGPMKIDFNLVEQRFSEPNGPRALQHWDGTRTTDHFPYLVDHRSRRAISAAFAFHVDWLNRACSTSGVPSDHHVRLSSLPYYLLARHSLHQHIIANSPCWSDSN